MATACSSADHWGRLAVWFILYAGMRLALAPLAPLPGVLFADPVAVLLPFALQRHGPHAIWAMLSALFILDLLTGVTLLAALGRGLVAGVYLYRARDHSTHLQIWNLSVLLSSVTAMLLAWNGNWTFSYLAGITSLYALFFIFLAGCFGKVPVIPPRSPVQLVFWLSLPLIALCFPGEHFWPAERIGTGSNISVRLLASIQSIALLLLAAQLLPRIQKPPPPPKAESGNGKWMQLAD